MKQGADIEKATKGGITPLNSACNHGRIDVVRYLLEQGADRDKANSSGLTPLHYAVVNGYLEIAMLLMSYGADLNARTKYGLLAIDMAPTEEINQAIRDEPRRRMDEAPGKRATEEDRQPHQLLHNKRMKKRKREMNRATRNHVTTKEQPKQKR